MLDSRFRNEVARVGVVEHKPTKHQETMVLGVIYM
jgi:hypothetical protein